MTAEGDDQVRRNVTLERLLARTGWTPENLGDRLNELAASHGLAGGHPAHWGAAHNCGGPPTGPGGARPPPHPTPVGLRRAGAPHATGAA